MPLIDRYLRPVVAVATVAWLLAGVLVAALALGSAAELTHGGIDMVTGFAITIGSAWLVAGAGIYAMWRWLFRRHHDPCVGG